MLPDVLERLSQETDFEGFEPSVVPRFLKRYVCAQCYGDLKDYHLPGSRLYLIFCDSCKGNVEDLGALSKNTVSIRLEEDKRNFYRVVRNLKDLYPELQHMVRIEHTPLRKGETKEQRDIRELGF